MEDEGVQGALGTGAFSGRVFRQGQLKEGVELDALAAEPGVVEDHAPAAHVAAAGQRRQGAAFAAGLAEHPEIPFAEVMASKGDATCRIPQPVEDDQRIGRGACGKHLQLKGVVESGIHQLERQPDFTAVHRTSNLIRDLPQPA